MTKHGVPIVRVVAADPPGPFKLGALAGRFQTRGDIGTSPLSDEEWDALRRQSDELWTAGVKRSPPRTPLAPWPEAALIVLGTLVLYWAASEPQRPSRPAARVIQREVKAGFACFSAVTRYELAERLRRGRIRGRGSVQADVEAIASAVRVVTRDVTAEIAVRATEFPDDFSHDPLDRLIAATARANGATLVTKDQRMLGHPLLSALW